jgi:hypothetical protein
MNSYLKSSIAVGVLGALIYGDVHGESHPHAEFIAISPTNTLFASGGLVVSNVSASTMTATYQPSPVTLEQILPHDHLVIQTTALTPPTEMLRLFSPRTGSDPFFQRRHHSSRPEVRSPKVKPFWCASFHQFRARMVTHGKVT